MSIFSKARNVKHIAGETLSFARGYRQLRRTNATPANAYQSLRQLYCLTNGRFNDAVSWGLSRFHPISKIPQAASILGDVSDTAIARLVRDIDANGFHVFDQKLPADKIEALRSFAESIPCQAILTSSQQKAGESADKLLPYRQHSIECPKYDITQRDILENPTVQELLMDAGLRRVAQGFLRCAPILDLVAMWWSRPFHGIASTEAAQLYHFDMDRIKFLKFFFYLTDVTPESGPHCYVRGSSKRKPKSLLRDGRISD